VKQRPIVSLHDGLPSEHSFESLSAGQPHCITSTWRIEECAQAFGKLAYVARLEKKPRCPFGNAKGEAPNAARNNRAGRSHCLHGYKRHRLLANRWNDDGVSHIELLDDLTLCLAPQIERKFIELANGFSRRHKPKVFPDLPELSTCVMEDGESLNSIVGRPGEE